MVKCHQDRMLQRNRKLARQLLLDHLDEHFNGSDSVKEQKKRYFIIKEEYRAKKASQLRELKKQYKQSLNVNRSNDSLVSSTTCDNNRNNSDTELK